MSGSTAVSISIPNYPDSNLVPGVFAVVDPSGANTGSVAQRALLIGQVLAGTSMLTGVPQILASTALSDAAAGPGSILADMARCYRGLDTFTEVWLLPLADDPAATPAGGAIVFSGAATAAGTVSAYIAGQLVATGVTAGETGASIAIAFAAAMTFLPNLPVAGVADPATGTVALTALNPGAAGNDIDIRMNYLGAQGGEATPAGLTVTISPMTGGTQNPTALPTALANLGTQAFDFIACPYADTASLNSLQGFLDDVSGRWSWEQELFGGAFASVRGSLAQRTTFAGGRNDQHTQIMGFYDSPSPAWEWAAEFCAVAATSIQNDPAVPITQVTMNVLAPPIASQDTLGERNTMLTDGLSTFTVDAAGRVVVERVVTTRTTNAAGAPDNSYRDCETLYTLMAVIRTLRIQLQSQYARKKLVADGTRIAGGSNQVTSQTVLGSAKAIYRTLCTRGLAQNPEIFAAKALAQNAGGGEVKLLLPVQVANQLRTIPMSIAFSKP